MEAVRGTGSTSTPRKPSSRRSSPNAQSPISSNVQTDGPAVDNAQPPPLTAAIVAEDYFSKELLSHAREDVAAQSRTVVILQDQCYGHRYSRPKTSKSTLSMIVERPERILASVLGVSAAYVRLGGRHLGAAHAPNMTREPSTRLPFKIRKTSRTLSLTAPAVTNVHGTKWMEELKVMCETAEKKLALNGKELDRPESAGGTAGQPSKPKFHVGDLYLSPESLNAFQGALGGVCDGVDAAFEAQRQTNGITKAFVCIRPPGHHCSSDMPSGFCWLNNVHIGIQYATQAHGLTHAAIIDFDLHHGDGSQAVAWEHNSKVGRMSKSTPAPKKTAIGYFSLHDINSYPCEYGDQEKVQNASLCIENAHGQSVWNVHLQPWRTEAEFWELYETRYSTLLEKARSFLLSHTERLKAAPNHPQPKAAIFLSAGFDASEWESQGMQRHKVSVPTEFYARFTRDVVKLSEEEGTSSEGRVISVLEGGYSDRALTSGILSHLSGLCTEQSTCPTVGVKREDASDDISRKLGGLVITEDADRNAALIPYDTEWWNAAALSALENLAIPPMLAPPKKPRPSAPHTYSSPTQASTARAIDPARAYRATSGTHQASTSPSRVTSPPPPEVEWTTAAYELSKLLIPKDRQTTSCKPEDLAESRDKKMRQSTSVVPTIDMSGERMQLRGRNKVSERNNATSDEDVKPMRSVSDTSRRNTIANTSELSVATADTMPPPPIKPPLRQSSRRSSLASLAGSSGGEKAPIGLPRKKLDKLRAPSAPADGAARPGSLQVKKSRFIANVLKPVGTRITAGVRERAIPRVPSSSGPNATEMTQSLDTRNGEQNSKNAATAADDDMSNLTLALKRITLKVPSKEEQEIRTKKAVDDGKLTVKPARKPPIPRKSKPAISKSPVASRLMQAAGNRGASHSELDDSIITTSPPQKNDELTTGPSPETRNGTISDAPGLIQSPDTAVPLADGPSPHENDHSSETIPAAQHASSLVTHSDLQQAAPEPSRPPVDAVKPAFGFVKGPPSEAHSDPLQVGGSEGPLSAMDGVSSKVASTQLPLPTKLRKEKPPLPVFTANGHIPFASESPQYKQNDGSLQNYVSDKADAKVDRNVAAEKAIPTSPVQYQ